MPPNSKPSNPHGPFGFWTGISLRARVRPERVTKAILMLMKLPLESTATVPLFFCFVDFDLKVCTHFKDGWILNVVVVDVVILFLVGSEPVAGRFCPGAIGRSSVGLSHLLARRKIARRKAENALTYSKITIFFYF